MLIEAHSYNTEKPKILISRDEVMSLIQDQIPEEFLSSIIDRIHKRQIDEQVFEFLYRKLYPFIERIFSQPESKTCTDPEKLNIFSKAVSGIGFPFSVFLEYFSDEDIVKMFELLAECREELKEPVKILLEEIFTKFEEASELYKVIIANRLLSFSPGTYDKTELEFNFKIILLMLTEKRFGDDLLEYYVQYVLPKLVFCSLNNISMARNIIEAVCSVCPDCQKITLKYLCKVYLKLGSNEQIKVLELTSKVIHSNFFHQANSFLEWDLCEIINLATTSESYIVVDAVIEMIDNSAVRKFIQNNIRIILPKIFSNLYRLSKKFWRQEQRFKAIRVIGNIFKIDNEVFEACLIEYNRSKQLKNTQNNS